MIRKSKSHDEKKKSDFTFRNEIHVVSFHFHGTEHKASSSFFNCSYCRVLDGNGGQPPVSMVTDYVTGSPFIISL